MRKLLNMPFIKALSFLASISIILCITTGLFTVTGAESQIVPLDISDYQIGSLGEYPVVNDLYNEPFITSYLRTSFNDSNADLCDSYLPFIIHNNKIYYGNIISYIRYYQSFFDNRRQIIYSFGGNAVFNPITADINFAESTYAYDFRNYSYSFSGNVFTFYNSHYPSDKYSCSVTFTASDGSVLSSEGDYKPLFARVGASKNAVSYSSISSSLSSLTYSVSNLVSAKFLHINTDDEFAFVDWITAGTQYPLIDFQINDNANLNSYSLRVSANSSHSAEVKSFHESQDFKSLVPIISHGWWIPNSASSAAQKIAFVQKLKECDTWVYDLCTTISSELFTFDNPDVKSKIFSLNLSDYTSILAYNIYRLEIVNNSDSRVLSTCYLIPVKNYDRTTSVYGIKSYEYGSKTEADTDSNNDSYTGTYVPGATGKNDNVSDLTFDNFSSNLNGLDISSIFGTLQTTLNSISYFFKACYSLIPASILSIVLCGLTLLVILRVLGR